MRKVLVWTEQHAVGGNDRFLAEVLMGLEGRPWEVRLAGIPNPAWDAWFAGFVPWAIPKVDVPVVTLTNSPLNRLRRSAGEGDAPPPELSAGGPDVPAPLSAAVATLRYRQAAWNLKRLERLFRGARPDVVFINNGGYPGAESCRIAPIAARRAGVPRVVQFVHNMPFEPYYPEVLERALDRRVDAAVDAWVTGAYRASAALQEVRGMTGVETVHYGIPKPVGLPAADDLGFADDAVNIACIAAFEARKGHAVLLDALARMHRDGVRFRCSLVGSGDEDARLRARCTELGLDDVVFFAGRREGTEPVLAAADVFVLASTSNECMPLAILEAMSFGLPVVSTDVAGIPEAVEDGVSGRVVAPGDAEALAAALTQVVSDEALRREMGEAGRRRAHGHFTIPRMVDELTGIWAG